MARKKYIKSVSIVNPICCGLDIHKDKICGCLIYEQDNEVCIELKEFNTFTDDLIRLRDWLLDKTPIAADLTYKLLAKQPFRLPRRTDQIC